MPVCIICDRLRELHLSLNEYRSVELPATRTFPSVKSFFFNSNAVTQWSEVQRLGRAFPRLESLVMMSNPLSEFTSKTADGKEQGAAGGLVDSARADFPCLKSLNVSRTPIKSWEAVDELRQFPQLVDVRLHSITCAEVIGSEITGLLCQILCVIF